MSVSAAIASVRKHRRIISYFLVQCAFYIASNLAHPVTPSLIQDRHFNDYMFGVALAAMMAMQFIFSPFWGQLCGAISSRAVIAICCAGYAVGQLGFACAPTEGLVIAARAFAGIFVGGIFTGLLNYTINTSDEAMRGKLLVLQSTLQSVVSAAGYFVGGMMGLISTETPFYFQAGLLLACAGLFWLVCRPDGAPGVKRPAFSKVLRVANPFSAFLASRRFMTVLLAALFSAVALAGVGQNAVDQCFNYYLRDQFQLSSVYNGIFKAAVALVSLLANATICLWLMRKTDIRRTAAPVTALSALCLLPLLFCGSLLPFVAGYVLFFACNAVRLPLLQSLSAQGVSSADSNLAMGFYTSMTSLGGIFGALFAGLIYARGARLPFWLAFVALLLAAALSLIYDIGGRRRHAKEQAA